MHTETHVHRQHLLGIDQYGLSEPMWIPIITKHLGALDLPLVGQ